MCSRIICNCLHVSCLLNFTVYHVYFSGLLWSSFPVSPTGIPLQEISQSPSAFTGRNFRNWLMELRNSHSLIKSSRSALIDRLLEGYDNARHGTGVCCHSDPEENFILTNNLYTNKVWFLNFCSRCLEKPNFLTTSKLSLNSLMCMCNRGYY